MNRPRPVPVPRPFESLRRRLVLALLAAPLCSLGSGCQNLYFGAMQQMGAHARQLLVERVVLAKEAQGEAQEQFQTALEAFRSATDFEGGQLEAYYKKIKGEYDRSVERATAVENRIDKVESASKRLFDEWQGDIDQMSDASMKAKNAELREDARRRYTDLIAKMRAAEAKMAPVLTKFKDRVLFIKGNLNYAAIDSLKGDLASIEDDVGALIADMQVSIQEADAFIAAMGGPEAG
jgi:uncharacterized protein YukE